MKANIVNKVSGCLGKVTFGLKKHSPEILVVAGVVGTVASTVMACKATLKVDEVLDDTKMKLEKVHEATEVGETEGGVEYSAEDGKKDTTIIYIQSGLKLAKLYAPAIILGTLSITSILASNNILRKRNMALAAAYATVDRTFKEYRSRVVDRFGEQIDNELRYGIKAEEVEEKVTDEKGKEKKVKKSIPIINPDDLSDFAILIDHNNLNYSESTEYMQLFLNAQQHYANDLLRTRGSLVLNTVYDALSVDSTKAGMVVGWVYDAKNPIGDNYVEFNVQKVYIRHDGIVTANTDDENTSNLETAYLVDFNVDGNIYDRV